MAYGLMRMRAVDGSGVVDVMMGDGNAVLSGGDGGWELETRPGLPPVTVWKSPEPIRQTLPVLYDNSGATIESSAGALLTFATPRGARQAPPVFRISGEAVQRSDLLWVIESLVEEDGAIRRQGDGARTRQAWTLTLLNFVDVSVLVERSAAKKARSKAHGKKKAQLVGTAGHITMGLSQKHMLAAGETLGSIAAMFYGDSRQWKRIAVANNITDPSRPGKPGRVLRIP